MEPQRRGLQSSAGVVKAVIGAAVEVEAVAGIGIGIAVAVEAEAAVAVAVVEVEVETEVGTEKRFGYVFGAEAEEQAVVVVHELSTCCVMDCRS
jgi:hypothetical protein